MTKENALNTALGFLQAFNGLSGLFGGYMLLNDTSGNSLHLNLEWLQETPFSSFFFPGLILFLFVGIGNILGAWITFTRKNSRFKYGLVFGLILMVWIISQVAWIGYKNFLQPLYFSSGLLQAATGFALLKLKKRLNQKQKETPE